MAGKDLNYRTVANIPYKVAADIWYYGLDVPGPLKGQTTHLRYHCKYNLNISSYNINCGVPGSPFLS